MNYTFRLQLEAGGVSGISFTEHKITLRQGTFLIGRLGNNSNDIRIKVSNLNYDATPKMSRTDCHSLKERGMLSTGLPARGAKEPLNQLSSASPLSLSGHRSEK
ncbi:hypothetical protein EYF80_039037 [Liparis tanakae]|uniref:Uncharacterized protein n=1 Tax=Liparis tanakae TaxID=230148 RepID=A0A4Z2GDM6_9TELE|nr:hypothetical protein EYF80_039037 [Liparis tanakae]